MADYSHKLLLLLAVLGAANAGAAQESMRLSPDAGTVRHAQWSYLQSRADSSTGDAFPHHVEPVGHLSGDAVKHPPDLWGPQRLYTPTPIHNVHFDGAPSVVTNAEPDTRTLGIRLDTTYWLPREGSGGAFLSEHQILGAGGLTILPLQTPCLVLGIRAQGGYAENMAMIADDGFLSVETYLGSRYKSLYWKAGAFWDAQEHFSKGGMTFSALTNLPIAGPCTLDAAIGWGGGDDIITPPIVNFNARRVEVADRDMQFRVGRFFTPNLQIGGTGNISTYEYSEEEWGAGAFCNIYLGRLRIGLDVTGGDEGLRGYTVLAFDLGKSPRERPKDCYFDCIDTVSWVTRATDRDLSIRLRESFTGGP